MRWIKSFVLFWYEFIGGDDWLIAAGVVIALALSMLLVGRGIDAWWLMPVVVVMLLGISLWRETRRSQ